MIDFSKMTDEQLLNMESNIETDLNYKLVNMIYDEELEQLYSQMEIILQEKRQRGIKDDG